MAGERAALFECIIQVSGGVGKGRFGMKTFWGERAVISVFEERLKSMRETPAPPHQRVGDHPRTVQLQQFS